MDREILRKGCGVFRSGDEQVSRRFVSGNADHYPVGRLCFLVEVRRSTYYQWRHRPLSKRDLDDAKSAHEIVEIHQASHPTYGAPRVHGQLRHRGRRVGRKRVARIMTECGLVGVHGRPRWRRAKANTAPAPDRHDSGRLRAPWRARDLGTTIRARWLRWLGGSAGRSDRARPTRTQGRASRRSASPRPRQDRGPQERRSWRRARHARQPNRVGLIVLDELRHTECAVAQDPGPLLPVRLVDAGFQLNEVVVDQGRGLGAVASRPAEGYDEGPGSVVPRRR